MALLGRNEAGGPPVFLMLLTDGAVFALPASVALATAVAALPVLLAAGVAGALVAGRPVPAVLTLAAALGAHAVATASHRTQLCGAKWGPGERKGQW